MKTILALVIFGSLALAPITLDAQFGAFCFGCPVSGGPGVGNCSVGGTGNNDLTCAAFISSDTTQAGYFSMYDTASGGVNYIQWLAPATLAGILKLQLPSAAPTNGQVMTCSAPDGSNISTCSWTTPGGSSNTTAGYFPFGFPQIIPGGGANVSQGGANVGSMMVFTAQSTVITHINYYVATAASSGSGMILGVFPITNGTTLGTPLCSGVASGTAVTTTGPHSVAVSCSGLVVGNAYDLVMSSDSSTLVLQCSQYSNGTGTQAQDYMLVTPSSSTGNIVYSAYSTGASTGTGSGLAFSAFGSWGTPTAKNGTLVPNFYIW